MLKMKKTINPQAKRWLWYIIILLAVITCLASCSTVSKVKRSSSSSFDSSHKEETAKVETTKLDSTATIKVVDTSTVVENETTTTESETGYEVIEIEGDASVDVIDPNDYFPPTVVVTKPNGKKDVYLPKKKETTTTTTSKTENKAVSTDTHIEVNKKDSTAEKQTTETDVSKKENRKEKTVMRNNYLWLLLLIPVYLLYRYRHKIKRLFTPI